MRILEGEKEKKAEKTEEGDKGDREIKKAKIRGKKTKTNKILLFF
jgi:hypothetical protein